MSRLSFGVFRCLRNELPLFRGADGGSDLPSCCSEGILCLLQRTFAPPDPGHAGAGFVDAGIPPVAEPAADVAARSHRKMDG